MAVITVEVAYATPETQRLYACELSVPCTVKQAIEACEVLLDFPLIDLSQQAVGIWGTKCDLDAPLQDGDRVEIYRPLAMSPTEARRLRAARVKAQKSNLA